MRDGTAFAKQWRTKLIYSNTVKSAEKVSVKRLSQETSVYVTGVVKEDERSKFGYELDVTAVEVIGESHDYPIARTRN